MAENRKLNPVKPDKEYVVHRVYVHTHFKPKSPVFASNKALDGIWESDEDEGDEEVKVKEDEQGKKGREGVARGIGSRGKSISVAAAIAASGDSDDDLGDDRSSTCSTQQYGAPSRASSSIFARQASAGAVAVGEEAALMFAYADVGWMMNEDVNYCLVCTQKFSGKVMSMGKKHHCYACGSIVCHSCSNQKVKIAELPPNYGPKRVCKFCFTNKASLSFSWN